MTFIKFDTRSDKTRLGRFITLSQSKVMVKLRSAIFMASLMTFIMFDTKSDVTIWGRLATLPPSNVTVQLLFINRA